TGKINNNIRAGSYNLATASNLSAKGFPAIDYLLYYPLASSEIIVLYTTDEHSEKRKQYLNTIIAEITSLAVNAHTQWLPSGGNYVATFSTSLGNDVGSSIGMLVNQLNYDYELIKTNKLAIPMGKKSLGTLYPEKIEGYYCTKSMDLIKEHLTAVERIYLGTTSTDENKFGLDDNLIHLDAKHNDTTLDAAIKDQFAVIKKAVSVVPNPLSTAITNNSPELNTAYIEIQKMVVLLKTDLPSALGVLITYQDNDGD
ncbi:MAG: imelysin family protein, partial [Bacteroidota bacterium]|nr:imelysin family protein [Bacteroidota bacterium]